MKITGIWGVSPEYVPTLVAQFATVPSESARTPTQTPPSAPGGAVAVIRVDGPIVANETWWTALAGATSIESLTEQFVSAMSDTNVKAIVFSVDSPGGEITGVHELASMIRTGAKSKQVASYVRGVAASAAYWLASAASSVVVDATARVGSIGVVSIQYPPGGDAVEVVSSVSPDKRVDVQTAKGRAVIQAGVDALADIFVADVAAFRGVTSAVVAKDFGRGGIKIGADAVASKMADSVGNLTDLVRSLQAGSKLPQAPMVLKTKGKMMGTSEETKAAAVADFGEYVLAQTKAETVAAAIGVIRAWEASATRVSDLESEIATLHAQAKAAENATYSAKLETMIASARGEGRLNAGLEKALRDLAGTPTAASLESVSSMVAHLPKIAAFAASPALGGTQPTADTGGETETVTHNGKSYAEMKPLERARLAETNPQKFEVMRAIATKEGV